MRRSTHETPTGERRTGARATDRALPGAGEGESLAALSRLAAAASRTPPICHLPSPPDDGDAAPRSRELPGLAAAGACSPLLDALPASVVLLDRDGIVVTANLAWRRFAAGDSSSPGFGPIGADLAGQYEQRADAGACEARALAAGIRRVVSGEQDEFSREYPDPSQEPTRWFRLLAARLGDGAGVLVSQLDITTHKRVEEALRTSEARLRAIVDGEPECVKVVAIDGRVLEMNPAGLRMLEAATADQVVGRSVLSLVHPEDRPRFLSLHRRVSGGQSGELEFRIVGLKGTERWMETSSTPLRAPDGTIEAVLSVTRDFTSRRRRELLESCETAALESISSDEPLATCLDSIAVGIERMLGNALVSILLLDEDGLRIRHGASPHLPKAYTDAIDGLPIGPLQGSCGTAAYRREPVVAADVTTHPAWREYRALALQHGLRACWSTPVLGADGRVLATFAVYHREPRQPAPADVEVVERAVHLVRLVLERERRAAALRASEEKFRGTFAHAATGIAILTGDGQLVEVNAAFCRMLGHDEDALRQLDLATLTHPDDLDRHVALLHDLRAGRTESAVVETRYLGKDGRTVWARVSMAAIRDADGQGLRFVAVAEDISRLKEADADRRAALERERAARREADAASRHYRSLFECAPGCYLVLTADDHTVAAASEAYLRSTMTTRAAITGRSVFDLFPDDPAGVDAGKSLRASLERVKQLGRADVIPVQRHVVRRREAGGVVVEERFWSSVNTPVPGPDGETAFIIHRIEDVTEYVAHKRRTGDWSDVEPMLASRHEQVEADIVLRSRELRQAHEQLSQSVASLRMASRISRVGAWYVDLSAPAPRLVGSPELHELLGLPGDYMPDMDREFGRYREASRDAVAAAVEACVRTGRSFDLQVEVEHASGRPMWARVIGEAARDPSGRVVGVQGAFQDISAQKEAERSLAESRRRFREFADAMPLVVFTCAPSGLVDFANASFARYAGVRESEPLPEGWLRAIHPDDVAATIAAWSESLASGSPLELRFRLRRADDGAHRWHHVVAVPARDEHGTIVKWYGSAADVDDLVRLEEDATRLARRLTTTVESLTEAFFTLDREWRFTYWNGEAERRVGRRREEILGRTVWDAFPGAAGTIVERNYRLAMDDNVAVSFEAFNAAAGGWLEIRVYPSSEGLAVYFHDVTELRAAHEALQESEERFRLLARATNDAIWDWNFLTDALWWNEGFETLFGFARCEIVPTLEAWQGRIHPDERAAVVAQVNEVVERGADGWSAEYRVRHKDGTYLSILDRGHVIRDASGNAIRMIGGMTDLTARKEAEQRVAEQAALLDAAHEAIIVKDLSDTIIYWNRGAERTFGFTAAEAIGRKGSDLLGTRAPLYDEACRLLAERGEWQGEMPKQSKDGQELVMDVRWTLVRDAAGHPASVFAIETDVTERRALEQQFLRAQRMESIGTLAGGIAHDLNNVLAPIAMGIELLQTLDLDARGTPIVASMEISAQRGIDLVKQVLSFARGVAGVRVGIRMQDVLHDVEAMVGRTFPKSILLTTDVADGAFDVLGDPTQLSQVLLNLCVNARDAMPEGGRLTLVVRNRDVDASSAALHRATPGSYVEIGVTDTGCGIPPEVLDRIFEPFFTTKEMGRGTGLGLSTVLGIVRSHGGFVTAESQVGHGTSFAVCLPALCGGGTRDVSRASPAGSLPRGDGELVLVVDDEIAILQAAQQTLEAHGYQVLVAADGARALELFTRQRQKVAAVVIDVMMPGMDGASLVGALRRIDPDVRVIVASGLDAAGSLAQAERFGARRFLGKPYAAQVLLETLRSVLDDVALEEPGAA